MSYRYSRIKGLCNLILSLIMVTLAIYCIAIGFEGFSAYLNPKPNSPETQALLSKLYESSPKYNQINSELKSSLGWIWPLFFIVLGLMGSMFFLFSSYSSLYAICKPNTLPPLLAKIKSCVTKNN
jgi:hypothetical protein